MVWFGTGKQGIKKAKKNRRGKKKKKGNGNQKQKQKKGSKRTEGLVQVRHGARAVRVGREGLELDALRRDGGGEDGSDGDSEEGLHFLENYQQEKKRVRANPRSRNVVSVLFFP